jgi:hypothetical protein
MSDNFGPLIEDAMVAVQALIDAADSANDGRVGMRARRLWRTLYKLKLDVSIKTAQGEQK